jgi:hypothetical protein|tara:strand:+ start:515 stop:646 length:132 start_codon:yes stop_codon:yes gene_type:complete
MNENAKKYDGLANYEVILYMMLGATLGMMMTITTYAVKVYCGG